jgi:hypothetical protein
LILWISGKGAHLYNRAGDSLAQHKSFFPKAREVQPEEPKPLNAAFQKLCRGLGWKRLQCQSFTVTPIEEIVKLVEVLFRFISDH